MLITTNFSLTYFIVSSEIEGSRVPSWLLIMDTEGLSVMTAWSAGKFAGDVVGMFVKKCGIADKIAHKRVIIPDYAAAISGEIEEELPDWELSSELRYISFPSNYRTSHDKTFTWPLIPYLPHLPAIYSYWRTMSSHNIMGCICL